MKNTFLALVVVLCSAVLNLQSQTIPASSRGTFTDPRDGQKYRTVEIGNLVWFADDLAYSTGNEYRETLYKTRQVPIFRGKTDDNRQKDPDSLIVKTKRATYQDTQKNNGDLMDSKVSVKANKKYKPKDNDAQTSDPSQMYGGQMTVKQAMSMGHDIYDEVVYDSVFIALYQWEDAVSSCPEGWRVPTDDDWKDLELAIGIPENRLSDKGFRGTNQAWHLKFGGYTKLEFYLLGTLNDDKQPFARDVQGYWWSSTFNMDGEACYRAMVNYNHKIARMFGSKDRYYCVRCVKNKED